MIIVGEELPRVYKKYRLIPTLFSEDEMWPPSAVQQQLIELQENRGVEDVREWRDNQSEDERSVDNMSSVIRNRTEIPLAYRGEKTPLGLLLLHLKLPNLTLECNGK